MTSEVYDDLALLEPSSLTPQCSVVSLRPSKSTFLVPSLFLLLSLIKFSIYILPTQLAFYTKVVFRALLGINMGNQEEEENLLENTESGSQPQKRSLRLQTLLLIISVSANIFFGFLGLFYLTRGEYSISKASYEFGFATDLGMYILNNI